MSKFFKIFWSTAVSLAGLVGAYFGAVPLHIVWLFWIIFAISVVAATFVVLIPRALDVATRVRDYPKLLQRAGRLTTENESLKARIGSLETAISSQWEAGVKEGRWQVLGSISAAEYGALELKGVVLRDGNLYLVAAADRLTPIIGARYSLESELTGDIMGVVEAKQFDRVRMLVSLMCIERNVPDFWQGLEESALLNATPPTGFQLVPYKIPSTELVVDAEPASTALKGA